MSFLRTKSFPNHLATIQLTKLTSSLNLNHLFQLHWFLPNSEQVQSHSHSMLLHPKVTLPSVVSFISFHCFLTLIFQILIQTSFKTMLSNSSSQIFLNYHHIYFLPRIYHNILFIHLLVISLSRISQNLEAKALFLFKHHIPSTQHSIWLKVDAQ